MSPIEMNQHLTKLLGVEITRFCRPLVDTLGIAQFYHYMVTRTGESAAVGLHSGLQEYLVALPEWGSFVPYVYHNMDSLIGLVFTQTLPNGDWKKSHSGVDKEFGVHLGLQISRKTPMGIEGFGFGLKTSDPLAHMALLNKAPALNAFIDEYKKTINPHVLREHLVKPSALNIPDFFNASKVCEPDFKKILLGNITVKWSNPLSTKEAEVAELLLEGYSARQIGDILFRSSRTVESHIESIKEKLDCSRRSDLIQKLRKLLLNA